MSMTLNIEGVKVRDSKWENMKKIWDACSATNIPIPKEVNDYFNGETPDEKGVKVSLIPCVAILKNSYQIATKYSDEYSEGYEINVKEIPADITIIRITNSW